jgi:hypothetical protein
MEVALSRYSDEDKDGFMKVWKAIHKEEAWHLFQSVV